MKKHKSKKKDVFVAWTDYPLLELGDAPFEFAPMRKIRIESWNMDKRLYVKYNGVTYDVHRSYVYTNPKTKQVWNPAWYYWNALLSGEMVWARRWRENSRLYQSKREREEYPWPPKKTK